MDPMFFFYEIDSLKVLAILRRRTTSGRVDRGELVERVAPRPPKKENSYDQLETVAGQVLANHGVAARPRPISGPIKPPRWSRDHSSANSNCQCWKFASPSKRSKIFLEINKKGFTVRNFKSNNDTIVWILRLFFYHFTRLDSLSLPLSFFRQRHYT